MDKLDSIPEQDEFRFEEIEKLKNSLELEIKKRKKLYKKYKKASNTIDWLETSFFIAGITIGSIGASGIVTNIVSLPVSIICTMLGLTGKIIVPRLRRKAKKHPILVEKNYSLNSVNCLISKAINNEHISASEFDLIMKASSQESERTSDSS